MEVSGHCSLHDTAGANTSTLMPTTQTINQTFWLQGAASRGLGSPVLQAGMRTSLETAVGLQLPAARYVASPAICMPDGGAPPMHQQAH